MVEAPWPAPRSLQRKSPGPSCGSCLAGHETDYRKWKASDKLEEGPGSPTFFTLGQRFTQLRNAPGNEWLQDYSYEIVRYACKYLGDGYAAFLDPDRPPSGPRASTVQGQALHSLPSPSRPKLGWIRLAPIPRYADGKPWTVRVRQEREGKQAKRHAYIAQARAMGCVRMKTSNDENNPLYGINLGLGDESALALAEYQKSCSRHGTMNGEPVV